MTLEPITTDGPTITVSTAEELKEAYELLSHQNGGGTILVEPGFYGSLWYYPYGETYEEQPVVIKSADPDNPAEFTGMYLREVSNLRIENVVVDGTANISDKDSFDVTVYDATNVQIVDSVFIQDPDDSIKDSGGITDSGVWIRDSDRILFQNNYLEGQYNALQVQNTTNTEIIGNEITDILGDGFRGGGLQNVTIADNYMHDFYVLNQHVTHTDMIQVWGSNSYLLTENLTISGNILIATDGGTQGIFIRNEEFGIEGDSTSGYFQNITVTDNLIYNGHLHGIRVDDTQGVVIDGNTVLWNPDATQDWGSETFNWAPIIRIENSLDTVVTNNVTSGLDLLDATATSNNQILTYGDPDELSYVGNHFVNPLAGADITLEDLYMLSTSSFWGAVGASFGAVPGDIEDGAIAHMTATVAADDIYEITLDAGSSTDMNGVALSGAGYSYYWIFPNGTSAEGEVVTHTFTSGGFKPVELEIRLNGEVVAEISRNLAIESKDIFAFDFEDGAVDISDATPVAYDWGQIVDSHDGSGFLIGDGNKLEIDRSTDELYDLDTFGLALDIQPTGDEPSGVFLHLYLTMEGSVRDDGTIRFSLTTDEGTYSLVSREPVFDDGEMHRIGIAFNGTTGQLEMFADGESVSTTEAWGSTSEIQYRDLIFGNTWNDSMDAIIDNVVMSADPAVAGDLPVIDPPEEPEPPVVTDPPDEPEEPPVVTDPPEEPEAPPTEPEEPTGDTGSDTDEGPPVVVDYTPDTTDDRGTPQDPVEADNDSGNVLTKLLDKFLELFGLGRGGKKAALAAEEAAQTDGTTLEDVVPITGTLDEDAPVDDAEEEIFDDLAA